MKTTKIASLVLVLFLIISSCAKKEGPAGPQGEQGPAGPKGNMSVTSLHCTVFSGSWGLGCSGYCWFYNQNFPALSSSYIVDYGAVMVYWKNGGDYIAMPYTSNDVELYFSHSLNTVSFKIRSASGTTTINQPGDLEFKIVMIPPAMIKKQLDYTNYGAVKAAYNLTD